MKTLVYSIVSLRASGCRRFIVAVAVFMAAVGSAGAGQLAKLSIQPAKSDLGEAFLLTWESVPDTLYRVQRSTDLGNNQNWLFGDAVIADSTNAQVEIHG